MPKKPTKPRLNKLRAQIKKINKEKSQLNKFKTKTDKNIEYFERQSIRAHNKISMLDDKVERLNGKINKLK